MLVAGRLVDELLRLAIDEIVGDDDVGVAIIVLARYGGVAEFHVNLVYWGADTVSFSVFAVANASDANAYEAETVGLRGHEDLFDGASARVT